MKRFKTSSLLILAAALAALVACGVDSGSDGPTGTVQLALTDAVDHNFSEVVVAIKEVRAVPAGAEGAGEGGLPLIVAYEPPLIVDVLELAYQQQFLGEAVVPAGDYSQLRLVLEANGPPSPVNYIVLADDPTGVKIPIDTPSGQQSGLKVVGKFTVGAGEITAVVLDFDPARAIVEAGQSGTWVFKPTGIRVVQSVEILSAYGAITGVVAQAVEGDPGEPSPAPAPVTEATVYAIPVGGTAAVAAGQVSTEDGSFRLLLPPGAYELQATAPGFQEFVSSSSLTVVTGADTDAGVILLEPIPTTP
ncbi:MAG: DUF4382 domain-containing protein [Deferrisomatales bacterium]|nr:DUF4382 domain-containing protein [Deferrisomatales bacterium]